MTSLLISQHMSPQYDVLIAGAGLAGASAARALARVHNSVLLIDKNTVASGASGGGAAIASPMMARKGRPVWRIREALRLLDMPGQGILRPAQSEEQAAYFIQSANESPDLGTWLEPGEARSNYPFLKAPFGVLNVHHGFTVDLGDLTRAWVREATDAGAHLLEHTQVLDWKEIGPGVEVELSDGKSVCCRRLLLAMGPDLVTHPKTSTLNLHPIKGESIRITRPPGLPGHIPGLSGYAYVVDEGATLGIGATFEHSWSDEGATQQARDYLIKQASLMLRGLDDVDITEHLTGIRVTVPGTRLPMIGLLPDHTSTWVFTGLGSKGIFMAALLGAQIPCFFNELEAIPKGCRVARKKV